MNKIKIYFLIFFMLLVGSSCEDFLDKSPDMGLSDSTVYKDYNSIRGLLDGCYKNLQQYFTTTEGANNSNNGYSYVGVFADEMAAIDNGSAAATLHSGNWLRASKDDRFEIGVTGNNPINRAYKSIRIANLVLENYKRVPNMTEQQINEIVGQAYFYRAWFYFQLLIRYGGMPKFDHAFKENGEEKIPRMTYHESHEWMMEDIENAIKMLPDIWSESDTGRPTKLAAMALKEMTQLYDASPLMQNDLNSVVNNGYDKEKAMMAAKSAKAVIDYINSYPDEYKLMDGTKYKDIFYCTVPDYRRPEYIWYNRTPAPTTPPGVKKALWLPACIAGGTANAASKYNAPTQNMVDLYEKKGNDGIYYPITDSRSGYDNQNPYKDLDPRFSNNILVPGEAWCMNANNKQIYLSTYVGGLAYNDMSILTPINTKQQTGYMCKKFIWPEANQWQAQWGKYAQFTVYIRVAQVYLDFAEAAFEATGNARTPVEGMTAEEAVNIIRARMGVTPLTDDRVINPDEFRKAYRNERAVELMFENHRWWDIRRWMILEEIFNETYPLKGILAYPADGKGANVQNVKVDIERYEVTTLTSEVRNYGLRNYWYPFPKSEVAGSDGTLQQNPNW